MAIRWQFLSINSGQSVVLAAGGHQGSPTGTVFLKSSELYEISDDKWKNSPDFEIDDEPKHQHIVVRTSNSMVEAFYVNKDKLITRVRRLYVKTEGRIIWKFREHFKLKVIADEGLEKIDWVVVHNDTPE